MQRSFSKPALFATFAGLFALAAGASTGAHAAPERTLLNVDLRDLTAHRPELTQIPALLKAMEESPARFFPAGAKFSPIGVTRSTRSRSVYGVELSAAPVPKGDVVTYPLTAFLHTGSNGFEFRKLEADVSHAGQVVDVRQLRRVR